MALRGPLFRLLRAQLNHTCQQSRAQSVAVLGAPFSRGQVRRHYIILYICVCKNVKLDQHDQTYFFCLFCDRKEEEWSTGLNSSEMPGSSRGSPV